MVFTAIYPNESILLLVLALFSVTSLVKVYDFVRDKGCFNLKTHYFFGLIQIAAVFSKEEIIRIESLTTKKSDSSDWQSFDTAPEAAAAGCLAAPVLSLLFDAGQSNTLSYIITYSRHGKTERKKKFNLYRN